MTRELDACMDRLVELAPELEAVADKIFAALTAIAEAAHRTELTEKDRGDLRHAPRAIGDLMGGISRRLAAEASSVAIASYQ